MGLISIWIPKEFLASLDYHYTKLEEACLVGSAAAGLLANGTAVLSEAAASCQEEDKGASKEVKGGQCTMVTHSGLASTQRSSPSSAPSARKGRESRVQ